MDLASVGRALPPERRRTADRLLASALAELDVAYERVEEGAYLVTLPTDPRPSSLVWLVAGDHGVLVESLFLRSPDQQGEAVYAALLARNARTRTVAFALDGIGDVYLVGMLPYAALTTTEVDALLGQVLAHVDESWLQLVAVGFGQEAAKYYADGAGRRADGAAVSTPLTDARR